MILLRQDTQNTVIVTLKEKTTLSEPYYLFEFVCDNTKEITYFTGVDLSTNKTRFNEFLIELTTGIEDRLDSILNMPLNGFYSYNIYSQVSATNLDINNITEIVESGKVSVEGETLPIKTTYVDGQKTKIVYNGN
tara:strand:+ start:531 stop:935 length:405 start_codon:yes stop_codon:yes gene_type:complete